MLAGGYIQAILVLLAWPTVRHALERAALADVYRKLAEYARQSSRGSRSFPPMTPLATARQVLADPQPFARAGEVARLSRLLEDSEIIRRRLGALATISSEKQARALAGAVATKLDAIANVLTGSARDAELFEWPASSRSLQLAGASDLASHVRDATEAATMLAIGRLPKFQLLSKARPAPYSENHIDWRSLDSMRYAVVLAIAMVLGRHFEADRGYWIPLTAAIVLKPDFQTTFVRGFARIAGTLAGAVIASLAVALVRGHEALQIAGVLVTTAAAYITFNPNYALFSVAITSFVVIVLSMRGLPGTTTVEARLLDTLTGGALAMTSYLILPSWERKRTRALLADLLDAQRRLASTILRAYAMPSGDASRAIESARSAAWRIRTTVEASIDRTRHEPDIPHTIGPARALRILAASQRFALANLALESALETEPRLALPELGGFADALDEEMAELAAALRESRRAKLGDRPARVAAQLEREIDGTDDPKRRFILERLHAYVEATDRLARLVGVQKKA